MKKLTRIITIAQISVIIALTACQPKGDPSASSDTAPETEDLTVSNETQEPNEKSKTPGPNGGRLIETVEPSLEFLLLDDRHVRITLFDLANQSVPAANQVVSLVGGDRSDPFQITFSKDGDTLLSDEAIPEGKKLPISLQIKTAPDSDPVFEKFYLNLSSCPECNYEEYACICGHEDE